MRLLSIPYKIRRYLGEYSIPFLEEKTIFGNKLFLAKDDIDNLKNIAKENGGNFLYILYLNKESIHDSLYNSDDIIQIDNKNIQKLSDIFCLDLLIKYEPNYVDYIFPKGIIINLCEELQGVKNNAKKIIMSKIIIDFIEYYKGIGDYDEKINEKRLEIISELCKKEINEIIKTDNSIFNDYKYENIIESNTDELYMDIFCKLIKLDSFDNDIVYRSINQMEFEEINITENMYKKFKIFLNDEKNNINKYFIENIEDLINDKKINFYYIVLKYLLTNQLLIYDFSFLLNAKNIIIESIRNNLYTLLAITAELKDPLKEKLKYIIKIITDSDYYFNKYLETKKTFKEIINNEQLRYKFPLIQILMNVNINDMTEKKEKTEFFIKEWTKLYDLIKEGKMKKIPKKQSNKLLLYLKEKNNKSLLLKIFTKEQYELFQSLDIVNDHRDIIESNYIDNSKIELIQSSDISILPSESILEENHVLKHENDSTSMIIESYTIKNTSDLKETEANDRFINNSFINFDINMFKKSDKYKVIEYYKELEKNKKSESDFNFTKSLSKGHYITGLNSSLIKLYNSFYEKKLEIYLFDKLRNVYEIETDNNEEIHLIACLKHKLTRLIINIKKYAYYEAPIKKDKYNSINFNLFFKCNKDYIISGEQGIYKLSEKDKDRKEKIFNENYTGAVKIKGNIYALTSNKLFPQGENKLVIFDFSKYELIKTIKNYFFDFNSNGLFCLDTSKIKSINDNRYILFCSCKKGKKYGFLVVNIKFKENNEEEISEYFYETKDFEPHCFCQLSFINNNNSINDDISNEKNIETKNTEYIAVGGFDPDKRMGCIKLYKIKFDKKNNEIKVKYLFELGTKDDDTKFKGFDMNITCITQSKTTGNLLINCLDGSISLFKPPNLEGI